MQTQSEVDEILSNVRSIHDLTKERLLALRVANAGRVTIENLQVTYQSIASRQTIDEGKL